MKFFGGRRKGGKPSQSAKGLPKPTAKKPESKPAGAERKPRKGKATAASKPVSEEMQRAKKMAAKASAWKPFSDACKAKGLKDPAKAFLDFYEKVKGDPKVWALEGKIEAQVEERRQRFSRTGFYARLFIDMMKRER